MKEMRVIVVVVIDMHVGIENQSSLSSCSSSYSQLGGVQTNGSWRTTNDDDDDDDVIAVFLVYWAIV
jgi:hypothetical protein